MGTRTANRPLTEKQRKFVEAFTGNATDAARKAGYKGSDGVLAQVGSENLRKPEIAAALKERSQKATAALIANRQARQEFWTKSMNDVGADLRDRLRASELLGKSEADFIERHEHSGAVIVVENPFADVGADP